MTFSNHGCNGTYNFYSYFYPGEGGRIISEQNAVKEDIHDDVDVYDPVSCRHRDLSFDATTRDIKAGEEILANYLFFTDDANYWWDYVESLKKICNGEKLGFVSQFEMEGQKKKEKS